jgi:hypothetical protein
MIPQIFQRRLEFGVELLETGVLVHVEVEEVAEGVVVLLEVERDEASVQCCQHVLCRHV